MTNLFKGKHGPLLIAEIGGNHEGDYEYAKHLTQLAIEADVDAVKFQIYTGDSLVSSVESPERNNHFKKFELTRRQHIELAEMVTKAGLLYTSSVWDMEAIEWLDQYMQIYKIGSGDLTAYPVLRTIAQRKKPMILSTGLATEAEVLDTINFVQSINPEYEKSEMLALLQCTSMYPIAHSDAHLNVLNKYKNLTGLTVGYSDHTEGVKALMYAAAMGAEILEFHFTDERKNKIFRDHKVSLMPFEIEGLIREIRLISELKGNPIKNPTQIEIENGHLRSFRRAVYPLRDINAGEKLTTENIGVLRPNSGIDARDYDKVLGKKTNRSLKKHEKLKKEYLTD